MPLAPYYVAVIPGGQSSAAALKDFGQQSGTSLTWTVDIAAGTSVSLKITDSTGNVNYNQAVTIREWDLLFMRAATNASQNKALRPLVSVLPLRAARL